MEMRFTKGWGEYQAGDHVRPNEVLSIGQRVQLVADGTLVPAFPAKSAKSTAKVPPKAALESTSSVEPTSLPKRGVGRPRTNESTFVPPAPTGAADSQKEPHV